jgi:hypothetical protein
MADSYLRLEFLRRAQNTDGGWGYFPGKESRLESTYYVLKSLPLDEKALAFLLALQNPDGGFRAGPTLPGSTWVTALAIPLLAQAKQASPLRRAASWLMNTSGADGKLIARLASFIGFHPVDQDPSLQGWPWHPGNNAWVEPTVHSLLALKHLKSYVSDSDLKYRRDQATALLRDRRCQDLGWNYGNKRVLDEVLPSYPETTGIALAGLSATRSATAQELQFAQNLLSRPIGSYAKSWITIGLRMNGIAVESNLIPEIHPSRNIALTGLELLASQPEISL